MSRRTKFVSILAVITLLSVIEIANAQRTVITHTTFTVTDASTTALAASNLRNYLLLTNISDTTIWCKFGATAVVNEGFPLYANGGNVLMDYKFSAQLLNCIHASAAASKTLLITSGVQ